MESGSNMDSPDGRGGHDRPIEHGPETELPHPREHRPGRVYLEDLIDTVEHMKLRVNNLFQLHTGEWQANLTDGEKLWEFGRGETPVIALQAAIRLAATTEAKLGFKQETRVLNMPKTPQPLNDISEIIGSI